MRVKKIRRTLQLKGGVEVRTIEELRENFDAEKFWGYFEDGTLLKWMDTWHHAREAAKVRELDDETDIKELCKIFGIEYSSPEEIAWRTERLDLLKKFTSDENILAQVDNVAFDNDDLLDILEEGTIKDIYLCGKKFNFSSGITNFQNKTYHGVGNVTVKFETDEDIDFNALGLKFENIRLEGKFPAVKQMDATNTPPIENKSKEPEKTAPTVENNLDKVPVVIDKATKLQILINKANSGDVDAMLELAKMYQEGNGVRRGWRKAATFYRKAANLGNATAINRLGDMYYFGYGIEKNFYKAFELYTKSADLGNTEAINNLAFMYENGKGVMQNLQKAHELYTKSADLGNKLAINKLRQWKAGNK